MKKIIWKDKVKFLAMTLFYVVATTFILAYFSDYLGHPAWIVGLIWGSIKLSTGFVITKFWVFNNG